MVSAQTLVCVYAGVGFCTCVVFILVNPYLGEYLTQNQKFGLSALNQRNLNSSAADSQEGKNRTRKNVLFIIVDDLRPQLGAYYDPDQPNQFTKNKMFTPHLDELSRRSLLLRRAYVQQPLCGPSRASLLTSRRPDVTMAFSNDRYWRNSGGNFTTLPQYFKDNGYVSLGFGKVFHTGASSGNDDRPSWSEKYYKPPFSDNHYLPKSDGAGWASVEKQDREKVPLTDDKTTEMAITALRKYAAAASNDSQHFFLAVGYRKPHLSFVCPKEFFSLYPLESDKQYMSNISWQTPLVRKTCGMGHTEDVDGKKILPDQLLRQLRRAYSACVSYTDSNVGMILDELDKLGLANSTVVSFMADHGYHLGENHHWGKMSPFELSTRVPMMLRIPGETDEGVVSDSLVEALDIYPTLIEAAGLESVRECPMNSSDIRTCTMGKSILPLINDPELALREAALSQVTALDDSTYTLRSKRFRFTEKAKMTKVPTSNDRFKYSISWDVQGNTRELYDHDNDPEETVNLADDPKYATDQDKLQKQMHDIVAELHRENKRV